MGRAEARESMTEKAAREKLLAILNAVLDRHGMMLSLGDAPVQYADDEEAYKFVRELIREVWREGHGR